VDDYCPAVQVTAPERDGTPQPSSPLEYASGATTVEEVVRALETEGFTAQMVVTAGGRLTCRQCGQTADADQFESERNVRTEGASDPADMSLVVALRCPSCSARGTLTVKYGPEAGPDESEVLSRLPSPGEGPPA